MAESFLINRVLERARGCTAGIELAVDWQCNLAFLTDRTNLVAPFLLEDPRGALRHAGPCLGIVERGLLRTTREALIPDQQLTQTKLALGNRGAGLYAESVVVVEEGTLVDTGVTVLELFLTARRHARYSFHQPSSSNAALPRQALRFRPVLQQISVLAALKTLVFAANDLVLICARVFARKCRASANKLFIRHLGAGAKALTALQEWLVLGALVCTKIGSRHWEIVTHARCSTIFSLAIKIVLRGAVKSQAWTSAYALRHSSEEHDD